MPTLPSASSSQTSRGVPVGEPLAKSPSTRIVGLDSIRFVCALWVVFAHLGLPFENNISRDTPIELMLRGVVANLFPGPPAVVVFFFIFGFFIHWPVRNRPPTTCWCHPLRR